MKQDLHGTMRSDFRSFSLCSFWPCVAVIALLEASGCSLVLGISDVTGGDAGTGPGAADGSSPDASLDASGASLDAPDTVDASGEASDATNPTDAAPMPSGDSSGAETSAPPPDTDALAVGDGASDAEVLSPGCKNDLSNIGTADFSISFDFATRQSDALISLADQRDTCGGGMFWDVQIYMGLLFVEMDDDVHYISLSSTGSVVNDGHLHSVIVQRTASRLVISIDGTASSSEDNANQSFGPLDPLRVGRDVCDGPASAGGGTPLDGFIADVCARQL